jgi:hypothetical protein
VQEACAEWVAALYFQTLRDPKLVHLAFPGTINQRFSVSDPARPPSTVAALLAPYVRYTITTNQG